MKKIGFTTLVILLCSFSANSQNEKSLSIEEKIYGLSELWKEASYNFAFFDRVPNLNWDSCYSAFIPHVMETTTDWEYYRVLERFLVLLHDGHTRYFPPAQLRNKYYGTATKQIKTLLIENKVIISEVLNDSLKRAGIMKGMEILMIDNTDVHEYAKKYVAPYMSASTPQDMELQIYGYFLLSGSVTEPIIIKVLDFNGNTRTLTIHRQPWLLEVEVFQGNPMSFTILPNNIGYLKIHNFVESTDFRPIFDSIYAKIIKTEGLIIDVRDNFGGATQISEYVLKHLTNKKYKTVNWKSPRHIAAYKSWGAKNDWLEVEGEEIEPFKDKTIYTKPVNVIADESSFSGAEDFCVGFKTINRGKLIGRKTAGSSGSPLMFNLSVGGLALICTKHDRFPDGTEFLGYGIKPNIEVNSTIENIRKNNDEALKVAIKDLINK